MLFALPKVQVQRRVRAKKQSVTSETSETATTRKSNQFQASLTNSQKSVAKRLTTSSAGGIVMLFLHNYALKVTHDCKEDEGNRAYIRTHVKV